MIEEDFRFAANQRVQWRSISDNPYNTFGFSADMKNPFDKDNFGAGVSFMHDITGDSRYRTMDINLSGAYIMPLSKDTIHSLSIGLQTGLALKSIDYSALSFDAQYNGLNYDASLDNQENFVNEGRAYLNVGTGLSYYFKPKDRVWGEVSMALYNLTKPKQSFFSDDDIRRDRRMLLQMRGSYPINLEWDIIPAASFMIQGKYKEIIVGSKTKYTLVDKKDQYRALYGGLFYRGKDAGYMFLGMDYDSWHVGLSYDLNLSNLTPASLKRGGWEVAVIYKLRYFKYKPITHRVCPNYMK